MSSDNNQGLIEIWEKADLYFKEALERAKDHQRVGLSDLATHYLMVILLGVMRDYDAYRRVMAVLCRVSFEGNLDPKLFDPSAIQPLSYQVYGGKVCGEVLSM